MSAEFVVMLDAFNPPTRQEGQFAIIAVEILVSAPEPTTAPLRSFIS